MHRLERAIFETVRWWDLFDRPVTELELVERLVSAEKPVGLADVRAVLEQSPWLAERVDRKSGFVFLLGREGLVRERLKREARAQRKWKLVQQAGRWLALVPFVRGLAGSGSLALNNTKEESDLDILVITAVDRIWLARLGLLLVAEVTGRRRRHWHEQAPDKLCLNHYLSESELMIASEIRNLYTATLYSSLVPICGDKVLRRFKEVNEEWMGQYMGWHRYARSLNTYTRELPSWQRGLKGMVESVLKEPVWDGLEAAAKAVQLYFIGRHQRRERAGRVVTRDTELAFHPDTKVPGLLARFSQ